MNILLIAATSAEIAPLIEYMGKEWTRDSSHDYSKPGISVRVLITGVGMVAMTYHLTKAIANSTNDFVVLLGIGGSFDRNIPLGEVVFIAREQFGDMGAEDHYNFLDIFDLGLEHPDHYPFTSGNLDNTIKTLPIKLELPEVDAITINAVSGSSFTSLSRFEKYKPKLESMEGAAFHYVCLQEKLPFAQVRSISNYVEARNRDNWELKLAINNLNNWAISFLQTIPQV